MCTSVATPWQRGNSLAACNQCERPSSSDVPQRARGDANNIRMDVHLYTYIHVAERVRERERRPRFYKAGKCETGLAISLMSTSQAHNETEHNLLVKMVLSFFLSFIPNLKNMRKSRSHNFACRILFIFHRQFNHVFFSILTELPLIQVLLINFLAIHSIF